MSQNTSTAVMQRRREPHDSLDFFPTPPWAARALCEHVIRPNNRSSAWEPACGEGHIARPLREYFGSVYSSDVHAYGFGDVADFLWPSTQPGINPVHWVITNPPFRLAEQFAQRALTIAVRGVALLVRLAFLESIGRWERLYAKTPPTVIAQFTERVPMVKGRVDSEASTATAYVWVVWQKTGEADAGRTQFMWIPPCRRRLELAEDYQ